MVKRKKIKQEQVPVNIPEKTILEKIVENSIHKEVVGKNNIFDPEGELVVDVFETNSDFVVLAALAGVQIKDLDIAVEKDMMVIKGHRLNPDNSVDKKYFYQECYWGPFSKKIVLPENIHTESAEAQMDKGVLTIKIPKINGEKEKGEVEVS